MSCLLRFLLLSLVLAVGASPSARAADAPAAAPSVQVDFETFGRVLRVINATTVVVILTSVFFGLYLFGVDLLIGRGVEWILRRFGAGA